MLRSRISAALALPLVAVVWTVPTQAQPTRVLSRVTASDGTPYRVELRLVERANRNALALTGPSPAESFEMSPLLTRSTRVWGFRYGQDVDDSEWLFFRAQDARYTTQYTWYFRTALLRYVATDRRTGRVSRGTLRNADNLPEM